MKVPLYHMIYKTELTDLEAGPYDCNVTVIGVALLQPSTTEATYAESLLLAFRAAEDQRTSCLHCSCTRSDHNTLGAEVGRCGENTGTERQRTQ